MHHVTRQRSRPATDIKSGDVIWIAGQIHSPWGSLPPAIDARIHVQSVATDSDGHLKFSASPESVWFPLHDATRLLQILHTVSTKGISSKLQRQARIPIGRVLQSIRKLENPQAIIAHTTQLLRKPLNFISYRIADGTADAFRLAQGLLEDGGTVYWDRWCLPRRLAERRELISDTALDRHLMAALKLCRDVWGVESPRYGEPGSYSEKEKALAQAAKTYKTASFYFTSRTQS